MADEIYKNDIHYPTRTKKQQSSLQIFCRNLADTLNEAGISQRVLLQAFDIDNSENSIKDIFRQIGKQKYGKESTAKLSTRECIEIFDEINREVAKYGIHEPWPNDDPLNY